MCLHFFMDPEKLLHLIKGRRSVRSFDQNYQIPSQVLDSLVEAARWAPSAGNLQPLEIILISNEDTKLSLVSAAYGQEFLDHCSIVMVMAANIPRTEAKYKERGKNLYCLQDVAAATQNVLLLVHAMELGSCWVGAFNEQEVSRICKLPKEVRPIVMIAIGKPDAKYEPIIRPRRAVDEFVHQESWQK